MTKVSTNFVSALGAGSGVDVKALAQSLTDAEKAPQAKIIQDKIDQSTARISGFSAMKSILTDFQTAVDGLSSVTNFSTVSASSSNPGAVAVTSSSLASTGYHSIEVNSLAKSQRSLMGGFDNVTSTVNSGSAFQLTFSVGASGRQTVSTVDIPQESTNASAVVDAINRAGIGVAAQLIDTGVAGASRYRIALSGQMGSAGAFSVSAKDADGNAVSGLNLNTPTGQEASDAQLVVDGVSISRSTNSISDVITGATLTLSSTTTTGNPVGLRLSRDVSDVKTKVQDLVTAYNNMVHDVGILTGPKSTVSGDTVSGSLKNDSTVRTTLNQIRQTMFGISDTKGTTLQTMRDLGVSISKEGVLSLDATALDQAVANHFDDVVSVLAGRQVDTVNGQTVQRRGIAATLSVNVRALLSSTGTLTKQSSGTGTQLAKQKEDMTKLETRMQDVLSRYTKQFATMESLVGQITSMRASLKDQFASMLGTNSKNN